MSIKSILYIFGGAESELYALNTALTVAKHYTAQLRILHATQEVTPHMERIVAHAGTITAMEDDNRDRLRRAKEYSARYAALHDVALNAGEVPPHSASALFVHRTGIFEDIIAKEGRMSDLIITGHRRGDPNVLNDSAITASLFNTGRPVLLVPRLQGVLPREWRGGTVTIAWNGSLEAASALYDAMPFLEEAGKVHVLVVRAHEEKHRVTDEKAVMEYLGAHGISSDTILIDRERHSIAEALLMKAGQLGADILVMGAYGHARFSEMILGGVTCHMLESADIPLLLSH